MWLDTAISLVGQILYLVASGCNIIHQNLSHFSDTTLSMDKKLLSSILYGIGSIWSSLYTTKHHSNNSVSFTDVCIII